MTRWMVLGLFAWLLWGWLGPQSSRRNLGDQALPYRSLIALEASRYRLPPALVAAVVLRESNFKPWARSRVGALGLMQLMPETGLWVHQQLEGQAGTPDLLEPATNLRLGSSYLSYLKTRFPGDRVAILAGYNAGPESVERWRHGELLQVVEIGFSETRGYVEAVLDSERMYRRLYPEFAQQEGLSQ